MVLVYVCAFLLKYTQLGAINVRVSTGKTPASPYEYGSFGKFLQTSGFGYVFVHVEFEWDVFPPPLPLQLTMAAPSVQRPSQTAPHQPTTTMDTWVWTTMQTHTNTFFWSATVTCALVSTAWPAVDFPWAALVTHRLSVCLCSSGQEPFHRRPILSHLHHIAIRIGDTLPHDWPNQFRNLHRTNLHYVNHTWMRLRCWFQEGARFLVWCHRDEQKKQHWDQSTEDHFHFCVRIIWKLQRNPWRCDLNEHVCVIKEKNILNADVHLIDQIVTPVNWKPLTPPWLPRLSSLPSLHQSDLWTVLDEAGRSLWAPWRRMTTTHWTTLTQTKTLSAQRYASSLLFNTNRKWPFCLMAVGDNVLSLFQKFLCVSDLARKDKRILSKKYQIYFWWEHWWLITSTAEE